MGNKKKSENVFRLQSAVTDIDSLSQEGFSEIASISKMTIRAIESEETPYIMDDILNVLRVIWGKADDIQNCINWNAEEVGCDYMSERTKQKIQEAMGVK